MPTPSTDCLCPRRPSCHRSGVVYCSLRASRKQGARALSLQSRTPLEASSTAPLALNRHPLSAQESFYAKECTTAASPPLSSCLESASEDLGFDVGANEKNAALGGRLLWVSVSSAPWGTSPEAEIGLCGSFSRSDIGEQPTERPKNQQLPGDLENPFRPILTTLGEHTVDWDGARAALVKVHLATKRSCDPRKDGAPTLGGPLPDCCERCPRMPVNWRREAIGPPRPVKGGNWKTAE